MDTRPRKTTSTSNHPHASPIHIPHSPGELRPRSTSRLPRTVQPSGDSPALIAAEPSPTAPMLDILRYPSVPSTVLPLPQTNPNPQPQPQTWSQSTPASYRSEDGRRQDGGSEQGTRTPTQRLVAQWLAGTREASPRGLQTPPLDMNGAAVNPMLAPTYGSLYNNESAGRSDSTAYQRNMSFYGGGRTSTNSAQPAQNGTTHDSSPTPVRNGENPEFSNNNTRRNSNDSNQIVSYLQIPASINDSKGSLAEFAAQITCLFWFESSFTLHRVEESKTAPVPTTPLVPEAVPTIGFRKWVTTILSTTQVTQNVILLALMFIYRLKKLNPTVKGKAGSEFRLLTVALMLGNKFLDDNTYTNKTWAEVSGISVQEIHIMEVEFLSNMRYTLYASELEWNLWHRKLGRFWDYFDKAKPDPKPTGPLTPLLNAPYPLPSPPASQHASPPFNASSTNGHRLHPLSMPPYMAPSIPSPMTRMPEVDLRPNPRKRSIDDQSQEQVTKRIATSLPPSGPLAAAAAAASSASSAPASTSALTPLSTHVPPRLPIPNLSISTNNHGGLFPGSYSTLLPTGRRSMATVYGSNPQRLQTGDLLTPISQSSGPLGPLPPLNDWRQSPLHPGSRTVSPTATTFNHQELLSPSGYPSQRSSPYRPVRGVNTLLVPPPSASFHNPSLHLNNSYLHYQPLGRPLSERKTGVVPYLPHDSWQNLPQMSSWPSLPQPTLPQPNVRL